MIKYETEFQSIKELHQEKTYPISHLCEIAGVSRSGYYKWLKWQPSPTEKETTKLAKRVYHHWLKRGKVLGYRQMTLQINRKLKTTYNKKRFYRLMKALGVRSVIRKKRPVYVKKVEHHTAENKLKRNFKATKPNQKWSTDLTELKYRNGRKVYLSAITDLYDYSIISYVIGHSNNNALVMETVHRAMKKNRGAKPMIQSDRGFQYTSHAYQILSMRYGFTKSMSRVSYCLDNQPIERFWGTYKAESYYLKKFPDYQSICRDVQKYIRYYNNYRYVKRFNSLSPNEYRKLAV